MRRSLTGWAGTLSMNWAPFLGPARQNSFSSTARSAGTIQVTSNGMGDASFRSLPAAVWVGLPISSYTHTGLDITSKRPEPKDSMVMKAGLLAIGGPPKHVTGAHKHPNNQGGSFRSFATSSTLEAAAYSSQPSATLTPTDDKATAQIPSYNPTALGSITAANNSTKQGTPKPMRPACLALGCGRKPKFNSPGISIPVLCSAHKLTGMVNVCKRLCESSSCNFRSSYNVEGESKGRFCLQHKHLGMVNVVSQQCQEDGCRKQPTFNLPGSAKARFCFAHIKPGMISTRKILCESDLCQKGASYNTPGQSVGRFCCEHQHPGMVNVIARSCEHHLCVTMPCWNFKGELLGRFCAAHKQQGMMDVRSKRCEVEGCSKIASFGIEGGSRRTCALHQHPGMVCLTKLRAVQVETV